jgi:hypothetical protein
MLILRPGCVEDLFQSPVEVLAKAFREDFTPRCCRSPRYGRIHLSMPECTMQHFQRILGVLQPLKIICARIIVQMSPIHFLPSYHFSYGFELCRLIFSSSSISRTSAEFNSGALSDRSDVTYECKTIYTPFQGFDLKWSYYVHTDNLAITVIDRPGIGLCFIFASTQQ